LETPTRKKIWNDPQGNWKATLTKLLGQKSTLIQGCQRIPSSPDDARLTLSVDSKASRRLLVQAIKEQRNGLKAMVQLTPMEKANKALAYRLL
jgi:hypothetical protein